MNFKLLTIALLLTASVCGCKNREIREHYYSQTCLDTNDNYMLVNLEFTQLSNGTIIGFIRYDSLGHYRVLSSRDSGKTWKQP